MKQKNQQDISEILKQLQASYLNGSKKSAPKDEPTSDTSDAEFQKKLSSMLAGVSEPPKKKARKPVKPSLPSEKAQIEEALTYETVEPTEKTASAEALEPIEEMEENDSIERLPESWADTEKPISVATQKKEEPEDKAPLAPESAKEIAPPPVQRKPKKNTAKKQTKKRTEVAQKPLVPMEPTPAAEEEPHEKISAVPKQNPFEKEILDTHEQESIDMVEAEPIEETPSCIETTEPKEEAVQPSSLPDQTPIFTPSVRPLPPSPAAKPFIQAWEQISMEIQYEAADPVPTQQETVPKVQIKGAKEDSYIRITPPPRRGDAKSPKTDKPDPRSNVIVIRPPVTRQMPSDPIVIRPRQSTSTPPAPRVTECSAQQEPIKIGKEARSDSSSNKQESENKA